MSAVKKIFEEIIQTKHKVITEELSKSINKDNEKHSKHSKTTEINPKTGSIIKYNIYKNPSRVETPMVF